MKQTWVWVGIVLLVGGISWMVIGPKQKPQQPKKKTPVTENAPQNKPGTLKLIQGLEGAKVVYVPTGQFWMGSPKHEAGRGSLEKRHRVSLRHGFWMWQTEVTQRQFQKLLSINPSRFQQCGSSCPVDSASFYQAMKFANAVSRLAKKPTCYTCQGNKFKLRCSLKPQYQKENGQAYTHCPGWRLPTEAEWERAARAGSSKARYGILDSTTWWGAGTGKGNSQVRYPGCLKRSQQCWGTHPVAGKKPNAWNLYDMLGNTSEWVWDRYGPYSYDKLRTNPIQTASHIDAILHSKVKRVVRGGCWYSDKSRTRAANRSKRPPATQSPSIGFRIVRTAL